jgi:hypothetical protein
VEKNNINPILSSDFWSSILEELPVGVVVIGLSHEIIYSNKIGEEIANLNTPGRSGE